MDPPTSCRRAASIDPSTTTENHQSHRRVGGKAPALSPVISTGEKEENEKKKTQNKTESESSQEKQSDF